MKSILAISVLIPFFSTVITVELNPEFVLNYFTEKNIRQMVVFACWQESGVFKFVKHIMNANARISYNQIQDHMDIANVLQIDYYKLGIVLDMDCPNSDSIFNKFSAAKLLFDDAHVWLTITKYSVVPTMNLVDLPLRLDAELVVALTNRTDIYMLYDVYNPSHLHGGKLNVTAMGLWNKKSGLKNYLTQYKYKRRQNLYGMMLNFSTILRNKPEPDLETYLTSQKNRYLDSMSRLHYALVLNLRDIYNFKINLKQDKDNSWGYKINGTYNGIVGDMLKGVVDISACHFQQRTDRLDLIEYTVPTYGLRVHLFFRHPKKNTLKNQFLQPFENNVWWLTLNLIIVCWIILLVAMKIENYYQSNRDQLPRHTPASDSAVIIIAAITQQGSSIETQFYSGRIVFLTMFLWLLVMFQFYSASIIGSLLAPQPRFINTLWDLADSDLDCGYEDVAYMRFSFAYRKDPDRVYLHKKKFQPGRKRKLWDNQRDGMHEVSKGGYAFSSETSPAYHVIENTFTQEQICEVTELPLYQTQYVSIITRKYSPFKKMVIYGIRQMVEKGIVNRLIKIWTHRQPQCPESFRSRPVPVALMEFAPAICLVLAGLIIAIIIMAGENFNVFLKRRKIKQEDSLFV